MFYTVTKDSVFIHTTNMRFFISFIVFNDIIEKFHVPFELYEEKYIETRIGGQYNHNFGKQAGSFVLQTKGRNFIKLQIKFHFKDYTNQMKYTHTKTLIDSGLYRPIFT